MDEEDTIEGQAAPLGATDYPWWVIALGVAVMLAFLYSLLSLPHNIALARELADARRLDASGNYPAAEKQFATLLTEVPGSQPARLGMAHALFADADASNDAVGLSLIANLKLSQSDWEPLAAVMPPAYRSQFVEEKR